MPDTTDGKKRKPINKNKRVPEGERVLIKLDIKDDKTNNVISRMKEGTANFLGLKPVTGLPRGKGKSYIRGAKGTKSFVLKLNKQQTIGGATVERLHVPVPNSVSVSEFYTYAQKFKNKGVNGIITPNGVSYGFGIDLSDDK